MYTRERVRQVAPRRDQHTSSWKRQVGVAQDLEEREGEAAARGVPSDNDVCRVDWRVRRLGRRSSKVEI